MPALPVEWVLAIFYGPSAHRATYGRIEKTKYTKDYIQLSRKAEFVETISRIFPLGGNDGTVPLTFQWPLGKTPGAFVLKSADRPHLKWETKLGAPQAWRMTPTPSESTAETIPGNPSHLHFVAAENELELLASRGAGQPYLLAIKLRDESNKLHLRAYLKDPISDFAWADIAQVPSSIRAVAFKTSQRSALASASFQSGGFPPSAIVEKAIARLGESANPTLIIDEFDADTGRGLAEYLRQPGYGLFFDPTKNHDAWIEPSFVPERITEVVPTLLPALDARFPANIPGDAAAERLETDPDEVEAFREQMERRSFEVPDSTTTVKTRGSAQKAFADKVKSNYGHRCAISGIETKDFLVAAHIVPWSKDQSIRLDPSNGICLSLILDRAFEKGYILIEDDHTVNVNWEKVGGDDVLRSQLEPYDRRKLSSPFEDPPKSVYLQRRRAIVFPAD